MLKDLSPEYQLAIDHVCKDVGTKIFTQLGAEIDWSLDKISSAFDTWLEFILSNPQKMTSISCLFCIQLDNNTTGEKLVGTNYKELIKHGFNIYTLNQESRIVNKEISDDDIDDVFSSNFSMNNTKSIIIQVENGVSYRVWFQGLLLASKQVLNPVLATPSTSKYTLDANQYQESMKQCYEKKFRLSGGINSIWEDKGNRILKSGKTEALFHDPLYEWLDLNLSRAKVVGNVKKISDDETDIEIVSLNTGHIYLIEVKWTGTNGKSSPAVGVIKNAIQQVKNYMEQEDDLTEACLVNFDGREFEKFNELEAIDEKPHFWKIKKKCKGQELPDNALGIVFYLENETASKRGQ